MNDAAIEACDVTLARGDLRAAAEVLRLARRTPASIRGNHFWAFAYTIAVLSLAASGRLDPLLAGGAMAFSSVIVVSSSLRLRRFTSWSPPATSTLRRSSHTASGRDIVLRARTRQLTL